MKHVYCLLVFLIPIMSFAGKRDLPSMGSPSAHHCKNMGGTYRSTLTPETIGLCTIGPSTIGAWSLYRFGHGQSQMSVTEFCKSHDNPTSKVSDIAGPQNEYCEAVGGESLPFTLTDQSHIQLCRFRDDTHIEVNTLFLGAKDSENIELNKILCCFFVSGC